MSLHLPWRVPRIIGQYCQSIRPTYYLHEQRRTILERFFARTEKTKKSGLNSRPHFQPQDPLKEEFLKERSKQPEIVRGGLAKSSIFEDEKIAGPAPNPDDVQRKDFSRNSKTMAASLDPQPRARLRWQRKMVIRQVRRRGRLSKAQLLKKQEREFLLRSHDFKTSVKKLVPLAKQIAGKTIGDAIIQMRFSKKKAAKDVKAHLEHAWNEAIVRRGLGLGTSDFSPRTIITKDKRFIKVTDPTTLYVDQAWCGKGPWDSELEYRARGRVNQLKKRYTSLSVVLKEEKTRIRLHEEREEKSKKRKVWTQLPNRPVTAQRQFYSW